MPAPTNAAMINIIISNLESVVDEADCSLLSITVAVLVIMNSVGTKAGVGVAESRAFSRGQAGS